MTLIPRPPQPVMVFRQIGATNIHLYPKNDSMMISMHNHELISQRTKLEEKSETWWEHDVLHVFLADKIARSFSPVLAHEAKLEFFPPHVLQYEEFMVGMFQRAVHGDSRLRTSVVTQAEYLAEWLLEADRILEGIREEAFP